MQRTVLPFLALVAACSGSSDAEPARSAPSASAAPASRAARDSINPRILRRFKAVRSEIADTPPSAAMIDLGRMLFFDKRLSKHRDLSCNSCHRLDRYGVDNEVTSVGTDGKRGTRNSPTVYHAAGHMRAFWDGRAANVEEQATGPIVNPTEMAMADPKSVEGVIGKIPGYVDAFHAAFPGETKPVTFRNVGIAIGAFERRLVTPSRWDRFLEGNQEALTADEVAGLKLFTDVGCMTCHTGEFLGGSTFQKVGVSSPWPNQADQGRFEVTKMDSDRMMFKVPSLRNVAMTAPYFHDGSAKTLEDAVTMMGKFQISEELGRDDVRLIVTWLGSLTGELPTAYIREPQLPADPPR
jgi:cytochrome c peroxidase